MSACNTCHKEPESKLFLFTHSSTGKPICSDCLASEPDDIKIDDNLKMSIPIKPTREHYNYSSICEDYIIYIEKENEKLQKENEEISKHCADIAIENINNKKINEKLKEHIENIERYIKVISNENSNNENMSEKYYNKWRASEEKIQELKLEIEVLKESNEEIKEKFNNLNNNYNSCYKFNFQK